MEGGGRQRLVDLLLGHEHQLRDGPTSDASPDVLVLRDRNLGKKVLVGAGNFQNVGRLKNNRN